MNGDIHICFDFLIFFLCESMEKGGVRQAPETDFVLLKTSFFSDLYRDAIVISFRMD